MKLQDLEIELYICVYCCNILSSKATYCIDCNEYKGCLTYGEFTKFQQEIGEK
jgi:hypothetical protein